MTVQIIDLTNRFSIHMSITRPSEFHMLLEVSCTTSTYHYRQARTISAYNDWQYPIITDKEKAEGIAPTFCSVPPLPSTHVCSSLSENLCAAMFWSSTATDGGFKILASEGWTLSKLASVLYDTDRNISHSAWVSGFSEFAFLTTSHRKK